MPVDDATLADTVAGTARAVPGVAGLHPGMFGEVATYLPGRRVTGIRIADDHIEVHVTVVAGTAVRDTAAAVRAAVAPLTDGRPVDVTIEDVATGPIRCESHSSFENDCS